MELYFNSFVAYLHGTENLEELQSVNYVTDAANYLMEGGMTQSEVEQLRSFISK